MNDFAGRTLAPSAFPTDDGAADPALLAVLEARGRGHAEVEDAYGYLLNARVLAPIVAVLGEAEEVQDDEGRTLRRDKNSDMALVTLVAPDGVRALPVFTSVAALTAWNPEARPMPVAFPRACAAAMAERSWRSSLPRSGRSPPRWNRRSSRTLPPETLYAVAEVADVAET